MHFIYAILQSLCLNLSVDPDSSVAFRVDNYPAVVAFLFGHRKTIAANA